MSLKTLILWSADLLQRGYDIDIIRKACNYIAENKEYFGKTILEVGCDAGYMTGFLAKTFPDAKIVSIDRSESAMNIAKANLEILDVHNVELKHCALKDVKEFNFKIDKISYIDKMFIGCHDDLKNNIKFKIKNIQ